MTVDGSYDATLASLLESRAGARIGFEAAHLTVSRHRWLAAALKDGGTAPPELVPTEGLVERFRVRKDEYELETLREGARRLSVVAGGLFEEIRRGRKERDIALAIDWRIRQAGFERPRLIRLWPAGRTPRRCRTPSRASESWPKATWSCWTSAASTTHTAST